ncbi:DUF47 family protein, partial [Desulfovibrio sp. OttesenSCG-928-G11]|nr:DUF47 family protein [Desulfovibrio sp. OttesenSCG-928-G11]
MAIRIPFFGLISMRSPLLGFLEHYEQIDKAMDLIEDSMECYLSGSERSACKDFSSLKQEVDAAEEKADIIKRNIRNHLPRNIFLPVDKHLFFSYTHHQDDILDWGQASLQWLAMRDVDVPEIFQKDLIYFLAEVAKTVKLLRPAIEGTIDWVNDEGTAREDLKERYRAVREQHKLVTDRRHQINAELFRSTLDFKDIYQLIHFV